MIWVTDIKRQKVGGYAELSASVIIEQDSSETIQLWYRYPESYYPYLSSAANPFVAALLVPAMSLGLPLVIEGAVSRKLKRNAGYIMDIIHQWWPRFKPIEIRSEEYSTDYQPGPGVGVFFSGGVDSFYTLLKSINSDYPSEDKISHLIFVKGFDIDLDDEELAQKTVENINSVVAKLNKEAVIVSSNYRKLFDRFSTWDVMFCGALMSVVLGIESLFKTVYIAAPHTYTTDLQVYEGSHPTLDHLWSTESIEVIHDGCEATRVEKVVNQIAKSQVALDHLRVCWENRDGKYNCGVCEKCIRTMLNLEVASVLHRSHTFQQKLDYTKIIKLNLKGRHSRVFMRENLEALCAKHADPKLLRAMSRTLSPIAPWRRREILINLANAIDRIFFGGNLRKWYFKSKIS